MTADSYIKNNKKICIDCGIEVKVFRKKRCKQCYRKWKVREAPKRKCICSPSCTVMISSLRYDGKPNYYAKMHNHKGEKHWNWQGGKYQDGKYMVVYSPYHPKKRKHNVVVEHRDVYEKYYNCCLLPYTEIDHINENKLDNRIENLRPLYKGQHTSRHHKGKGKKLL